MKGINAPADTLFSIDTDNDGATTLVTHSNVVLKLTPKAAAELCDHLINALQVSITLTPHGRYVTSTKATL